MGSRSRHLCHSKLLGGEIKGDGRLDLLMTYTFSPRQPPPLPLLSSFTTFVSGLHTQEDITSFTLKLRNEVGGFCQWLSGSDMQEVVKSTKSGKLLEYTRAQ